MKQIDCFPFAFFEGKIVPIEEAKVSIMTNALQYGTGVFAGIRGYLAEDGKTVHIFRLADHFKRFTDAFKILNCKLPYTAEQLFKTTIELAQKNKPDKDCYIRPIGYASNLGLSPDLAKAEMDVAMYMIPLGEYLPLSRGLKLMISSWTRITDNSIPTRSKATGGYINSSLAKGDAVHHGYDDALMMNQGGHITEASAANFFMVRDGVLITPPKNADVLEGFTRKSILELAKDLAIPVEEREVDRTELYVADEAFLSGTGVQVAWIENVDGRTIGHGAIGPITQKLQALFFDIVRGKEKKYAGWLTKI